MYKSLDFSKVIKFAKSPDEKVKYIKPYFSKPLKCEKVNNDDENDFEGTYLGEMELRLMEHDLSLDSYTRYKNKKDLDKKIIEFLKDSHELEVSVKKDEGLIFLVENVRSEIYNSYKRGDVSALICTKKFLENHRLEYGDPDCDILITDSLPDNIALTSWVSPLEHDIAIMAYIDKFRKRIKLASMTKYVCLIKEED